MGDALLLGEATQVEVPDVPVNSTVKALRRCENSLDRRRVQRAFFELLYRRSAPLRCTRYPMPP